MAIKNKIHCAFGLALLVSATQASGQGFTGEGIGVGMNWGLFGGVGFDLAYAYSDKLQFRAILSQGLDFNESENGAGNELDYEMDIGGGFNRFAVDYHPFGGTFYVSAGYAFSDFAVSGSASGANKTVGDRTFTQAVSVETKLAWEDGIALAAGWGHSPEKGLGFNVEIGALLTGSPNASISGQITGADAATEQDFNDALDEEETNFQNDVSSVDLDFLPIVQIGLNYRF